MPNYVNKTPTIVTLRSANNEVYRYLFGSRIQKESNRAELGHTLVNDFQNLDVTRLIAGSSRPKPARAKRREPEPNIGWEESFCSHDRIAQLRQDGWSIKKGKGFGRGKNFPLAEMRYVLINGIKYAYKRPRTPPGVQPTEIESRLATPTDDDLILGANFPRPPKFRTDHEDPEDNQTDDYSTFGQLNAENENWTLIESIEPLHTADDAATVKL